MGIKACCRKNCKNVMCDYYFEDMGYLCNSCANAFSDAMLFDDESNWDGQLLISANQLNEKLKEFVQTEAPSYRDTEMLTVSQFMTRGFLSKPS